MKYLIKDKKIVIIDIETSGLFCGENGKEPAHILRVDATKIENGNIGETFFSLVACSKYINKYVRELTGISNNTLKGAPRLKAVLTQLKKFTNGYEVYARNSEFINKFLSYYGNKNGIQLDLAKEKEYNEISKFLRYSEFLRENLKNSNDLESFAIAKILMKE